MSNKKIKGYKGFDKDLKCLGFQYEVGKDYEQEGEIRCCENGFHLCENPLDVFEYYSPTEGHRFCEVEGSGKMDKYGNKMSFSTIHISAEIGLSGIINAGVKFILDKVNLYGNKATNTGDLSAATNTGDRSAATNTGDCSAATNTGNYSAAEVKGKDSIAIVTGINSKARGAKGCWIVLTERDEDWHILDVKAFKVDGVKIKTNTFYMLKDGEPVEYGKDEQE